MQTEYTACEWFMIAFQNQANGMAMRIGGPVFLVGSALMRTDPHDYDVRIVVSDEDFRRLYGNPEKEVTLYDQWNKTQWNRAYDNLKLSRRASRLLRKNVDVQVQSQTEAKRYQDRPKVRLDSAPESFFRAGDNDA